MVLAGAFVRAVKTHQHLSDELWNRILLHLDSSDLANLSACGSSRLLGVVRQHQAKGTSLKVVLSHQES